MFQEASLAERDPVAAMLARAFAVDPAMSFIFPDAAVRARRMPHLFRLLYASDARAGTVFAYEGCRAATLWRAPGRTKVPLMETVAGAPAFLAALGPAVARAIRVSHAIESHMPRGRFWYLHIAGCDPAAQGKGLGGGAIRAGLDRFGRTEDCYLETATEKNIGIYNRLGFEVIDTWTVSGGGPRFWSMLRPAG